MKFKTFTISHADHGAIEYRGVMFADDAGGEHRVAALWPGAGASPEAIVEWLRSVADECERRIVRPSVWAKIQARFIAFRDAAKPPSVAPPAHASAGG